MNELDNINFYQLCKVKKCGSIPLWKRKLTISNQFEKKVKMIRKRAKIINHKLKTA